MIIITLIKGLLGLWEEGSFDFSWHELLAELMVMTACIAVIVLLGSVYYYLVRSGEGNINQISHRQST